MSNKIALTQNEFNLLLRDNHPEYDSCSSRDVFIEDGSGCDRIFERIVIRESDKAEFNISFIHNNSFGDYQDWIHDSDCDFYIDSDKKDIYDRNGQVIPEKEPEQEVVKEKTNADIYQEFLDNNQIPSFEDDNWLSISVEDFISVIRLIHRYDDKNDNIRMQDISSLVYEISIKHKVNVERLWAETFQNTDFHKLSENRLKNAFSAKKSLLETKKIKITLNGQEIYIDKSELNEIANIQKDLTKFRKLKKS